MRVKSLKNMLEGPCGYVSSRSLNAADINLTLPKQEVTGSSSKDYDSDQEQSGSQWEFAPKNSPRDLGLTNLP